MQEQHLTNLRFTDLGLHEKLLSGLAEAGFTHCTPIQAECLPLALQRKDVAGQAQTGTGKTAAFLLATMDCLLAEPAPPERKKTQPRAIILAPTRELAIQIHKDALQLGEYTDLRFGLIYGGTGYEQQRADLEAGIDILIGTPGRVIDYFKQKVFDLNAIRVVVLDEADRMFDLGFIKDIRFLLRRMPHPTERLNMLFSATLSLRVNELAYEHMNSPTVVRIEPEKVTAEKVRQVLYHVESRQKIPLMLGLLARLKPSRALIFVNTKRAADRLAAYLEGNGYHVGLLSGDVPQLKRQKLIARLSNGELPILVATDVAARGLHIPEVSHVFNYDLPQNAEDYVHRIGRTARAGASGDAVTLACEEYVYSLMDIEDLIGYKLPVEAIDEELLVKPEPPAKKAHRRNQPPRKRSGSRPRRRGSHQQTT